DPGSAGPYTFAVEATDALLYPSGPFSYSMTVTTPVNITTTTLPNGTEGVAYSQAIAATGGTTPYTFTTVDPLPAGINRATNATLKGTPAPGSAGVYTFDVTVTDPLGSTDTQTLTLTIIPSPLVLAPAALTLPNATEGTNYTFNFTATGGTAGYTFT